MKNKNEFSVASDDASVKIKITLSKEKREKIPRPGDSIFLIEPFAADEDDEDDDKIIKKDAIKQYTYVDVTVMASVLADDLSVVTVNGDYELPLDGDLKVQNNGKRMVFFNEKDAEEKFNALTTASIEETTRRIKKYNHILDNLEEAKKKHFH